MFRSMIDLSEVDAVLLADGWHLVDGKSLALDRYEYSSGDTTLVKCGAEPGISQTGFWFNERTGESETVVTICGPLTSILAVKRSPRDPRGSLGVTLAGLPGYPK